jgi:two-component system, OmpR family, lantibiotic biosynthesis sensor histidine kinase NisK/SpaK
MGDWISMDWIEDVFDNWKKTIKKKNLYQGMLYTSLFAFFISTMLHIVVHNICYNWLIVISVRYGIDLTRYMESGWPIQLNGVSEFLQVRILLLKLLYLYGVFVFLLVGQLVGLRIFYKNRMVVGLEAAKEAIEYMVIGDFSHEQSYMESDEIGSIFTEIELLRLKLIEEKQKDWNFQSEQKHVNAAFAHDLRTPLTIMKGYTEFLLKYLPLGKVSQEELYEKIEVIYKNQNRLLEFTRTMTEIQTLDMRVLQCKWYPATHLIKGIHETVKEFNNQSKLTIQFHLIEQEEQPFSNLQLFVDETFVVEAFENLLTNALRFANKVIEVQIAMDHHKLLIFVKDDGDGFSQKALREGKKLYYSEDMKDNEHFGLGLYISQKLCAEHGGNLTLINGIEGGAIAALEFRVGIKQKDAK